jgi:hypothetical protein
MGLVKNIIIISFYGLGAMNWFKITSEIINQLTHVVGLSGWGISPMQGLYLHKPALHRRGQTFMALTGFEPTSPVAQDPRHRPRGHCDQLRILFAFNIFLYPCVKMLDFSWKRQTCIGFKAVPLHAMEALGERGDIAPTH